MPTSSSRTESCQKAQPWKAHWPPMEVQEGSGVEYGVEKGAVVVVDGTSAKVGPSRNEAVAK